ncbi:E3 ubiquitin-protein ligase [Salix suchowensis]|nr:E3 ubiquitin-protein ligase [Salix suchowensis]
MQNDMSDRDSTTRAGAGDLDLAEIDLEKQDNNKALPQVGSNEILSRNSGFPPVIAIAFSNDESTVAHVAASKEELPSEDSPRKESLSRTSSLHEQCRVCQQEKEEVLIDLGCKCKGGLAKSHRTCIDTWFSRRGSNKCEICQAVAVNVSPPESQPSQTNYWVWRIDPNFRPRDHNRGCFSPLWVAFSILTGGLLLDVLISITLGVSALPVNIIIGVIVVLGLGTALRVALDFCIKWSFRRPVQREDANVNHGYHPAF